MRHTWIDYAKLFSICLVISYHTPPRIGGYVGDVVQLLRMPAFFLIAGYLFKDGKFKGLTDFLRHRSRQLLVPYTSFFVLFYILWLSIGRQLVGGEELSIPLIQPFYEFLWGSPTVVVATYWFISCLFTMQIIWYILIRMFSRKILFGLILALPYTNCIFDLSGWPWQLQAALNYLPFYALANLMKERITTLHAKDWPWAIIALTGSLVCAYTKGLTDNPWLGTTFYIWGGLLILPAYILLCKAIVHLHPADKAAEFIGKNTIIILALQNYMIGFIVILANKAGYGIESEGNALTNIIITCGVLTLSAIPIQWINRYIPFIIGRSKGPSDGRRSKVEGQRPLADGQ